MSVIRHNQDVRDRTAALRVLRISYSADVLKSYFWQGRLCTPYLVILCISHSLVTDPPQRVCAATTGMAQDSDEFMTVRAARVYATTTTTTTHESMYYFAS